MKKFAIELNTQVTIAQTIVIAIIITFGILALL